MQTNFIPPERSKTSAASAAAGFVLAFIKAKKDLQLYPSGNAAVTESIQKMLECLQNNYPSEEIVEILFEKDRLFVNMAEPDKNDPRMKELSLSLFRRGVRKILLDPSIPPDEIKILLGILNLPKEKISAAGGIEKLSKSRNIIHAVVEEAADLMILDGENFSLRDQAMVDDKESAEPGETEGAEIFGNIFVRVQAGDRESVERLQALLKRPERFSRLLEKFSLQVSKVEEDMDPASRIDRLLKILRTAGATISQVSSKAEQKDLMQNLAMSVLNMSASIREDLVNHGLIPNLALKSIESDILSQFPAAKLADALMENFQISGATSTIMRSYFNNLDLSRETKIELADALKVGLNEQGFMTPELDATLAAASGGPEIAVIESEIVFPAHTVLRSKHYPAEKVLFMKNERQQLRSMVGEALKGNTIDLMAPALLELMRHENVPMCYPPLVAKVGLYLEEYLGKNDYEKAAELLTGLQEEYERKKSVFSEQQLEPLRSLLDEYSGDEKIEELAAQFRAIHGEGPDFERLLHYFKAAGASAISSLMRLLEEEPSRHARLLICKMVAQCGEKNIITIADKLKHPKWYVARNAVLILGQTGSPAAAPYLRKALSHKDIRVRKEALKALAAIRSGEAIEVLCSAIEDENPAISKAAMSWVTAIGAEQALPALQKALEIKDIWKRDDEFLSISIEALKSIGAEKAEEILEKLARVRSFFRRRKAASIRSLARTALEELSHE